MPSYMKKGLADDWKTNLLMELRAGNRLFADWAAFEVHLRLRDVFEDKEKRRKAQLKLHDI